MAPRLFSGLSERLLKGGVAPRHVHRFIRELREHYEDALRTELANGATQADAERGARERLGAEEDLAQSLLAQPELRSTAARFPVLLFGAGPILSWLGVVLATLAAARLLPDTSRVQGPQSAWLLPAVYALCLLYVRVLPVGLGLAALVASARQRLPLHWACASSAVLNVLAGTLSINVVAAGQPQGDQLGVSSPLLPFLFPFSELLGRKDLQALAYGCARALCMLAVTLTSYLLWRYRENSSQDPA